jgi:hypothetical protein
VVLNPPPELMVVPNLCPDLMMLVNLPQEMMMLNLPQDLIVLANLPQHPMVANLTFNRPALITPKKANRLHLKRKSSRQTARPLAKSATISCPLDRRAWL